MFVYQLLNAYLSFVSIDMFMCMLVFFGTQNVKTPFEELLMLKLSNDHEEFTRLAETRLAQTS